MSIKKLYQIGDLVKTVNRLNSYWPEPSLINKIGVILGFDQLRYHNRSYEPGYKVLIEKSVKNFSFIDLEEIK